MLNKLVTLLIFIIFSFGVMAETYKEVSKVNYKKFKGTAKQEVIVFKFTNLIAQNILLSYKANIWHDDVCVNCEQESNESRYTIHISDNQTITTSCNDKWKEFAIFSAFIANDDETRYESLTKFELKEITISHE